MAETSKKGGMSSSSSGSGRMIKLRTGDGKKVEVEENIAMQFQTIKVMFEDGYDGDEIPIPNVSSKILTKVIEYCKVHLQSTDPNDFEALRKLEAFDTKFVKVAQSTLFHIILAANYLNITSLMDLTCKTVASIIEKKNVEEIRAYFDVENDYTPEEEEALRKEIEKPLEGDENVGVALLTYPVLMASDILLYQSDFVPVGEDQKQHLELTRELAERVNYLYGGRKWKKLGGRGGAIFKVPEPLIPPTGARVMSLTDGLSKMSKSAPSDQSRINLLDSKDIIMNKIKRCKTDSFPGMEFDNPERPECNNLLSVYQIVSGKAKEDVVQECQNMNWGTFKLLLTDALVDHLQPIQDRYKEITADSAYVDEVLAEGASKAADIADATLNNVYQAMGFLRR